MDRVVTLALRGFGRALRSRAPSKDPVFARVDLQFDRARQMVRVYYLVSVFISYMLMERLHFVAERSSAWDFLWPVAWLPLVDVNSAIAWLSLGCLLASLAAFQFPGHRAARGLFAVLCLMVVAIENSQGGIGHAYHLWLWIGICLVLLPDVRGSEAPPRRVVQMTYLSVVFATQALILFTYTLAGFWKFAFGTIHLAAGVVGNFSPTGFALQLADRLLQTGTSPLLAHMAIDNYLLSWPMFLATIYIQGAAVIVAFRPRLHMVWGWLLIGFHIGTWVLMEIPFPQHVLWAALLFVMSPFRPQRWTLSEVIGDLPILGLVFRHLGALRRRPAPPRHVTAE